MKMFALIQMIGGSPNLDQNTTPYTGYVLCDSAGSWGAYLISGSGAQLTAINALPNTQVIGICQVSETTTKWPELDTTVAAGVMTALNNWKTANRPAWPSVTAGMTYRTILNFLFNKFNSKFDLNAIDIA